MELSVEQLKVRANALKIAKFEGYDVNKDSLYGDIYYSDDNERTAIDTAYHTSWEWLMPVVAQCITIASESEMHDWEASLGESLTSVTINVVLKEVLEFIDFYNKEINLPVYFQPEFVNDEYPEDKDGIEIHSFEVYKSKTEAQKDFPNHKIQMYVGEQIEEPTYRDADLTEKVLPKKKFRVWATMTESLYLDVEATSKEEAEEIGENADGGDFISDEGSAAWNIDYADEL